MKILLDHCVPRRLREHLRGHEVKTAVEMGWELLQNGKLLAAGGEVFDVMVTVDQNIKHQQHLAALPIAVRVLVARSNRVADLVPLIPELELSLASISLRTLVEIGSGTA